MGKGGGCVPSKKKHVAPPLTSVADAPATPPPTSVADAPATPPPPPEVLSPQLPTPPPPSRKVKVFIVFYSMYGHVESLAKELKKGVDSVEGVEGFLFQVPETLPPEVLEKMGAPEKDASVPVIGVGGDELLEADGVVFGFPTRYGAMAAQMKAFFDSTGGLWREQKLAGKPAGFFVSTGTQGGGQETTAWTAITQLAHHGMLFVPIGYTFGAGMFKMDSIKAGTPYGAGVFAGDGSRQATETELALAEHQGKYMASVVKKLALA